MANAANQQLAATLGGQYLNPFLSPLIQRTAADISTNVAQQFSGAGRTPGSPMSQQQAIAQVAQAALPLAFQEYGNERQRQLGIATRTPSLVQTGQQLEQLQRQQNLAPAQALQQYAGLVSPIASGFPVTSGGVNTRANPLTTAARRSNLWFSFRFQSFTWCWCRIIRRTTLMDKIRKIMYDFDIKIQKNPSKALIGMFIAFCLVIIIFGG